MTLLQIVQNVLSSLNSDTVNSINDTTEAQQVATIVQTVFFNMCSRADLPEQYSLFELQASGSPLLPVYMTRPANVGKVSWLKYFDTNPNDSQTVSQFGSGSNQHGTNVDLVPNNWSATSTTSNTIGLGNKTFTLIGGPTAISSGTFVIVASGVNSMVGSVVSYTAPTLLINVFSTVGSGTYSSWSVNPDQAAGQVPGWKYVTILPIQQFVDMVNTFNPMDTNVQSYNFAEGGNNFLLYFKNDHQPTYCTCVESNFFLFDSYDNTQDTTLQQSKTMGWGQIIPPFTLSDSFIPDLSDYQFPLLLNEVLAKAWFELKQSAHPQVEREIKRQWSRVQKDKSVTNKPSYFNQLANFGRRPGTGGYAIIQNQW